MKRQSNSVGSGITVLDVVIPVYNEQEQISDSVRTVHAYLSEQFAYPFRITVADNASTDGTLHIAHQVQRELPGVRVVHLDEKGRGRALKQTWLGSDALVLAYMDVDLSTDLDALAPLVASLMSGRSDVAIGSRLARGANVVRGAKREFISRSYNQLLRTVLRVQFTDAQCGFKAIRADVARELLPLVKDTTWFFDTEMLVLAQWSGLRTHEVPVDWYDDPDSRVDIPQTVKDDLAGVWRLLRTRSQLRPALNQIRRSMGRGRLLPVQPAAPTTLPVAVGH